MKSGKLQRLLRLPTYDIVSAAFSRMFPYEFDRAIPVWNCGAVEALLQEWNLTLNSLSYALAVLEAKGQRPSGRQGLLGPHVDLIEDYTLRLVDLQRRIILERQHASTGRGGTFTGAYIVLFKTQAAASLAAAHKTIYAQPRCNFYIHPAPSPEDVNWPVVAVPFKTRVLRRYLWFLPCCAFVMFPVGLFTSILSQLHWILCIGGTDGIVGYLSKEFKGASRSGAGRVSQEEIQILWPAFCEEGSAGWSVFKFVIVSWLPGLLNSLWASLLLPRFFHFFAMARGNLFSLSSVDRRVLAYFFWFNVLNIFLSGLLGGWFSVGFGDIFSSSFNDMFSGLGYMFTAASNYFLLILSFKTFAEPFFKLLIPNGNTRFYLWRKYMRKHQGIIPERELELSLIQSRSFRSATEAGRLLLVFVLGLSMSIAAPLVTLMACLCLLFEYLSLRYRLLYLYIRKIESGGCSFPLLFDMLLGCLCIMVLMSCACLASKHNWVAAWVSLVTLLAVILLTGWYCRRRFRYAFDRMPLEVAIKAPPAAVDPQLYLPIPLHPAALGWHPYWIKCWQGWGPAYQPSWAAKMVTQPAPRPGRAPPEQGGGAGSELKKCA